MSNAVEGLRLALRRLSYREGSFVLKSGRTSTFYLDCKVTSLHPDGAVLIGEAVVEALTGLATLPGGVAGVTLGGDPLVTATSIEARRRGHYLPALIVRKEPKGHGTGRWVEGLENLREPRVAILEDVVTTGGSTLTAIRHCREEGVEVAAVVALVDRLEGGRAAIEAEGTIFLPLLTIDDVRRA